MNIKFLGLNMYMGKCMDNLLPFLKKEQFDVLSLQEVSGGEVSFDNTNTFQRIAELGYDGQLLITWRLAGKPQSFFGQAVFFKSDFTLLGKEEIWLKPYVEIADLENFKSEKFPKAVLGVTLEKEGKKFSVYSAHLAWSPRAIDTPEKLRQGKIFFEHMKKVKMPFILSGDFNLTPTTKIISWFDRLGRNLVTENNIQNTMNLRIHRHKEELIEEGGVVVDYVYTSPQITVSKFELLDLDLSDHLGLSLEASV